MNTLDPEVMPTPEQAIEAFHIDAESENDPMMLFAGEKGIAVVVLNGFGPGQMGLALRRLLPELAKDHGAPKWITICAEAYQKAYEPDKAPVGGHRPGELQERAESGDPTVVEVVMANGFSKGKEWSATQPFERKDGEVIWGELSVKSEGEGENFRLTGAIPDAIRPIFTGATSVVIRPTST
jgi:hypothetical protein